jgi:hypothetical protein
MRANIIIHPTRPYDNALLQRLLRAGDDGVSWSEQSQVLCIGLGALNDCYLSCQGRFEYEPQI